jgi:transposase
VTASAAPLVMSAGQREALEKVARSQTAAHREVRRARVLLDAADGVANKVIAARREVTPVSVRAWRQAFEADGLAGWGKVAGGRGRKASIAPDVVARIVELTNTSRPKGHTHWSCRTMAAEVGVSPATVQRIWSELGLKPHRVETFKVSNDPRFTEKLIDVVGTYLNPPTRAVVLCMDESGRVEARHRS